MICKCFRAAKILRKTIKPSYRRGIFVDERKKLHALICCSFILLSQ